MKQNKTELLIVGAGMAGLSFAALAAQQGFDVTVIDREHPATMAQPDFDVRTVALSMGTRQILAPLGIWDEIVTKSAPITLIDVQEGHDPFLLNFNAEDVQSEAFGWIFPNSVVRGSLYECAQKFGVKFMAPEILKDIQYRDTHAIAVLQSGNEIQAQLIVGADGRMSRVRDLIGVAGVALSYHQTALVGLVQHEHPHQGLAVERFYPGGPFAILPFVDFNGAHHSAIVWTTDDDKKQRGRKAVPSLEKITKELESLFDERYGAIKAVGAWAQFPLSLYHAKSFIAERVALISDAAHAIHPIAGQGLNLGMRDVAVLVEELVAFKNGDNDLSQALKNYQKRRRFDVFAMVAATDVLNRLFGNKLHSVARLRSFGLGLVDKLPPLKRFFAKTAMGQ